MDELYKYKAFTLAMLQAGMLDGLEADGIINQAAYNGLLDVGDDDEVERVINRLITELDNGD